MVSREDREGRVEEGKEDRNTAIQKKYRTRAITENKIQKKIIIIILPLPHLSIHLFVCLLFYLSVFASCISYLLREGMGAFSETSYEMSFGVTVGGNECMCSQRQISPPSPLSFRRHTHK